VNFSLSDEQNQLMDGLDRLVRTTCPIRKVHDMINGDAGYDTALWRAVLDFGAGGLLVAEQFGGTGLEMIDAALVAEVLGYHAAPTPFLGHVLATVALGLCEDDDMKREWLPKLADGGMLGTVALCDGQSRWQPEEWTLAPVGGLLDGEKTCVPSACEAGLIVVGLAGGALGLVVADAATVTAAGVDGVDRTRRMGTLTFRQASVMPLRCADGAAGRLRDAALLLLAADAFGGARRALEMAVAYAGEREQFGVKIGTFQALKHQLANIALDVEPCRGLYWYAAHAYDHRPQESEATAALAKAHIAESYLQAARDSVEAHGGIGFTWEYDVHLFLKRAMFDFAWGGAPAAHRERYARLSGW
jgi:alkylation response protein AidB-like acyl-CoA dehydrogenase